MVNVFFFCSSVPASRNEYQTIKQQLEVEKIPGVNPGDPTRSFHSLTLAEQAQMEKKRLQGRYHFHVYVCYGNALLFPKISLINYVPMLLQNVSIIIFL